MKVTLIAHTYFCGNSGLVDGLFDDIGWAPLDSDDGMDEDCDALGEFAGRACYQSWGRPNPATATNEGYMANILKQDHESVLEHASVTFYVEGVSRSLTHELIRHRHLSYSELSQRYVNVAEAEIVEPPAVREHKFADEDWTDVGEAFEDAASGRTLDFRGAYTRLVKSLEDEGLPRKKAREAARAVMPNMIETKIVVTGNLRAWRDVLKKRWHVAADAEIREFAGEALRQLREVAPNSFQDIPDEPYS